MSSETTTKRPLKAIDDKFYDKFSTIMNQLGSKVKGSARKFAEKYRPEGNEKTVDEIFGERRTPTDESGRRIMIQVQNLSKIYGRHPEEALKLLDQGKDKAEVQELTSNNVGLHDVSFEVMEGEIFVLMGLSGSGKSTLERCMNRLIEPTSGRVIVDGLDFTALKDDDLRVARRDKMSMVFQNFALLPHRDILNNIAYGLEMQGKTEAERHEKAREIIELVGLAGYEESMPTDLSGGMQQRVGLARALATDPDILFMDEAFSALDPLIRGDMQDELIKIQSKLNKTIVFVTHDLNEALKLGDRIALMKDGKIVQIGSAEDILQRPADSYVSRFVQEVDRTKVLTAGMFMRRPRNILYVTQGPRTALRLMDSSDRNDMLVIDRKNRFLGRVESDDILRAVKAGESDLTNVLIRDMPTVTPDTQMSEVIVIMVTTDFPIPVVSEDGCFLGTVSPSVAAETLNGGGE